MDTNSILIMVNSIDVNGVPTEIKILPLGLIKSQKGEFIVDTESFNKMQEEFKGRSIDKVIDYEHQTLEKTQAPAGGWIKKLLLKSDGIYARVEWTQKAKEYIANREYRYLSPVILIRKSDRKAVLLHSVALTNSPAIDGMEAIINSLKDTNMKGAENMDVLKEIAKALGLTEVATLEEVLNAIKNIKSQQEAAQVVANSLNSERLKVESESLVEISLSIGQIGESQKEWAINRCMDDVEGFKSFVESAYQKERDKLVEFALTSGKIAPFQKEWAEDYASKDFKGFKVFMENAPKVIPYGSLEYFKNDKAGFGTSNMESPISDMLGVSEEDIKKYNR